MDNDVVVFAQVMTVIVSTVTVLLGVLFAARVLWNRTSPRPLSAVGTDNARLERIENAVDAIAIEVERISEAQRFTTTLLADRLPAGRPVDRVHELGQPAGSKRINTPH